MTSLSAKLHLSALERRRSLDKWAKLRPESCQASTDECTAPTLFERNSEGLQPLTPTGPGVHLLLAILAVLVIVPVTTLVVLSSTHILTHRSRGLV